MERRRFSQTMAYEWKTALVVFHKMRNVLLTAVNNNKSLETARFFLHDRDQDQHQIFKTKTKTFIVIEAPRDPDPGIEDYTTGENRKYSIL